jgi:lipoprotein-anchoring transpeptidase ErfK/SrfK
MIANHGRADMSGLISRRSALLGAAGLLGASAFARAEVGEDEPFDFEAAIEEREEGYDPALLPPAESETDFEIAQIDPEEIEPEFRRQMVPFDGPEMPGTLIVDPNTRHLFLVRPEGEALRYGAGVGRAGFAWSGTAEIRLKRRWPRWLPPKEMVARDPKAAQWANGQPGGPDNPLGARALYLYSGGVDTLYRIHGTNAPKTIGKAMSSGCVRLLNQDIEDLYRRVIIGTQVIVRPSTKAQG